MIPIFEIEKEYKEELESLEEWNYLRNIYRSIDTQNKNTYKINKIEAIKSIFYGFKNWFRSYDYLVFSYSSERRLIKNKFFDIRVDSLIDIINNNNTLLIENPDILHKKKKLMHTKVLVSRRLIDIFTIILVKLTKKNYSYNILDIFNKKDDLNLDYSSYINRFNAQYKIHKLWFKLIKPKVIYLDCFYDKQYIIKAAKELDIEIIDVQHGLIGKNHSAYFSRLNLSSFYLPDKLFSFGISEKKNTMYNGLIKKENIFPIGSFYLDYKKRNRIEDKSLIRILSNYNKIVGVTLQWTVEDKLIDFIINIARIELDTIFILIPRTYTNKYTKIQLPKNVILYPTLDFYTLITYCTFHTTVNSTCALEAPILGIDNILIDIDNLATLFLKELVSEKNTTIALTEKDFIKALNTNTNKNEITSDNNFIKFSTENLRNILNYSAPTN